MMSATISNLLPQVLDSKQATPIALRRAGAGQDPIMNVTVPMPVVPTTDSFTTAPTPEATNTVPPTVADMADTTAKKGINPIALAVGVGTSLAASIALGTIFQPEKHEWMQRSANAFLAAGVGVASTIGAPIAAEYIQDLLNKKPVAPTPQEAPPVAPADANNTNGVTVQGQPNGMLTPATTVPTTVVAS
jgi:hypothetical protein